MRRFEQTPVEPSHGMRRTVTLLLRGLACAVTPVALALTASVVFAAVIAPTVKTEPASSIAQTTATLNATVNPNGAEVSECKFEYGTSLPSGKTATCTPSPGSGTSAVPVSGAITGLAANTTYHFKIIATNSGGTSEAEGEFKTQPFPPPTVKTEPASSIAQTTATLNATVNPNGSEVTECRLEYGTTTAYGASAPCSPAAGAGSSAVAVSAAVASLAANTTYHFRVVAKGGGGTSTGADAEFKTPAQVIPPQSVETKPASTVIQAPIVKLPEPTSVKPTVRVIKAQLSGNVLLVTVELSQKGTVRISGTGLRTTTRKNLAAGSHRIRVPLTRSGVAARKHRRKLIVHVALTVAGTASF
jgi:hypothetical protein